MWNKKLKRKVLMKENIERENFMSFLLELFLAVLAFVRDKSNFKEIL